MSGKKKQEKSEALKELKQGIDPVVAPTARDPAQVQMAAKARAHLDKMIE